MNVVYTADTQDWDSVNSLDYKGEVNSLRTFVGQCTIYSRSIVENETSGSMVADKSAPILIFMKYSILSCCC